MVTDIDNHKQGVNEWHKVMQVAIKLLAWNSVIQDSAQVWSPHATEMGAPSTLGIGAGELNRQASKLIGLQTFEVLLSLVNRYREPSFKSQIMYCGMRFSISFFEWHQRCKL